MSAEPADLSMPLHKLVWVCVCMHEGVCMQVCTVPGKVMSNAIQASRTLSLFLPLLALPTGYTELEEQSLSSGLLKKVVRDKLIGAS